MIFFLWMEIKILLLLLNKGDFLVCYPSDGHRTAVKAKDEPETIKKAILKLRLTKYKLQGGQTIFVGLSFFAKFLT